MKKIIMMFLLPTVLYTQETVNFKVINDDPNYVSDKLVNAYFSFNYGKNSSISIGFGADGMWRIKEGIDIIGDLSYSPALLVPFSGLHTELGGAYHLSKKSKIKDTKVVTKWSDSRSQVGNTIYEKKSVSWVDSKATYLSLTKVRGGLYIHKSGYSTKVNGLDVEGNFGMTGIFLGFEKSSQAALISQIDNVKGVTSGLTRIYLDGLVIPLTKVDGTGNGFGVGGRIGFWTIFNPNKAKKASPEKLVHYQAYQTMFFKAELGYRPFDKYYFSMSCGINVFKNR